MSSYKIVSATTVGELTVHVDRLLTKGYQPLGGVSAVVVKTAVYRNGFTEDGEETRYSQAMLQPSITEPEELHTIVGVHPYKATEDTGVGIPHLAD